MYTAIPEKLEDVQSSFQILREIVLYLKNSKMHQSIVHCIMYKCNKTLSLEAQCFFFFHCMQWILCILKLPKAWTSHVLSFGLPIEKVASPSFGDVTDYVYTSFSCTSSLTYWPSTLKGTLHQSSKTLHICTSFSLPVSRVLPPSDRLSSVPLLQVRAGPGPL